MIAAVLPAVWILAGVALTALVAGTNRAELADLHVATVASRGRTVAAAWFALAGLWSVLSWPLLVAELAREGRPRPPPDGGAYPHRRDLTDGDGMSGLSSVSGRHWFPLGARAVYRAPAPGDVIAYDHQAWRVVEVRERPVEDGIARTAARVRPVALVDHPDPVKAARKDRHLAGWSWSVYPDPDHYPVCACCGEPYPCRIEVGRQVAEREIRQMGLYDTPGLCPACKKPVTDRQRSIGFTENLVMPGGPPVVFHLRKQCRDAAMTYEQRWAAQDPDTRRCTLSCTGTVTNHNDGTYDCTASIECPGPTAYHTTYQPCSCVDCHSQPGTRGAGARPDPVARRKSPGEAS